MSEWRQLNAFDRSFTCDNVSELGHVVDLTPAMLTDPSVSARIIGIDGW
jgi:hypothetical protein